MRQHREHRQFGSAGRLLPVRHHRHVGEPQHRGGQDKASGVDGDRLGAPGGDGRIGRDDEEVDRAVVDGSRDGHVGGPGESLPGDDPQLNLDDDRVDRDAFVIQQDDDRVGTVLGWLDLGQVDRGKPGIGVGGDLNRQHPGQKLGGEGGGIA